MREREDERAGGAVFTAVNEYGDLVGPAFFLGRGMGDRNEIPPTGANENEIIKRIIKTKRKLNGQRNVLLDFELKPEFRGMNAPGRMRLRVKVAV